MFCIVDNAYIKSTEVRKNRKGGEYLLITFRDRGGNTCRLTESEPSRFSRYRPNTYGSFHLRVSRGRKKDGSWFTSKRIDRFIEGEKI